MNLDLLAIQARSHASPRRHVCRTLTLDKRKDDSQRKGTVKRGVTKASPRESSMARRVICGPPPKHSWSTFHASKGTR